MLMYENLKNELRKELGIINDGNKIPANQEGASPQKLKASKSAVNLKSPANKKTLELLQAMERFSDGQRFFKIFKEEAKRAGLARALSRSRMGLKSEFKTCSSGFFKSGEKVRAERRKRNHELINIGDMDSRGKTSRAIQKMNSFSSQVKNVANVTRNATQNLGVNERKTALPNIDLRKRSVRMKDNNLILKPPTLNFGGRNDTLQIESITERSENSRK